MNPNREPERVFPLAAGSSERARLRAPRLLPSDKNPAGLVMGNRSFIRAWAARRASAVVPPASRPPS